MLFTKFRFLCFNILILFVLVYGAKLVAQVPVKYFEKTKFDSVKYSKIGFNKKIPREIRPQVLTALYFYPELKDTKIIFRFRKRTTPLSCRPQIFSVFKKSPNRIYVITISKKSNQKLSPILFDNLPYNAQIGVLGHELAHITEYRTKSTVQLVALAFKMFNARNMDKFEFNTDLICIQHGLGFQLYDWSSYVRNVLNIPEWKGPKMKDSVDKDFSVNERYMNPTTIEKFNCISANTNN